LEDRYDQSRGGRIVTEPEEAINVLGELTGPELAERTRILQDARCPNIRELPARRPELGVKHIVVAIDEYAELVTILPETEREEFERQILRLAQRARAVGIPMIIATQRPTAGRGEAQHAHGDGKWERRSRLTATKG
jgi:S-DNA-T family DNA segregation ATPase FtsK/SpoIIIE